MTAVDVRSINLTDVSPSTFYYSEEDGGIIFSRDSQLVFDLASTNPAATFELTLQNGGTWTLGFATYDTETLRTSWYREGAGYNDTARPLPPYPFSVRFARYPAAGGRYVFGLSVSTDGGDTWTLIHSTPVEAADTDAGGFYFNVDNGGYPDTGLRVPSVRGGPYPPVPAEPDPEPDPAPDPDSETDAGQDLPGDTATTVIPCPPRYRVTASSASPVALTRLGKAAGYRCVILSRGGRTLEWDVPDRAVAEVSWERRMNETAEHRVTLTKRPGLLAPLGRVQPWAHEAAIWRIPERGAPQLCAVGPVTSKLETATAVTLTAKDLTVWWSKRMIHRDYAFTGCVDLTTIARWLVNDGLAPDDPGILEHAVWLPAGVAATRSGAANRLMLDKEMADLAGLGLDWVMIGRRLIVSGELARLWPRVARLNRSHFLVDVEVEHAGGELLTRTVVTGSGTTLGYAGGVDADLGLLESTAADEAVGDPVTARLAARAALAVAYPTPVYVRIPDGAALAPSAPIPLGRLVPGVAVHVEIGGYADPVAQVQRLNRVAGSWDRDAGERIAVSLAPLAEAPADDGSPVGPAPFEDVETDPDDVLIADPGTEEDVEALAATADPAEQEDTDGSQVDPVETGGGDTADDAGDEDLPVDGPNVTPAQPATEEGE